MEAIGSSAASQSRSAQDNNGAYVLRELIRDVPLSADGDNHDVYITAVEAWEGNLYIGSSDGQILHFVSIPPDPSSGSDQPEYILASRNEPAYTTAQTSPLRLPGVEQILLLPLVGKACILCNGTLTFYTLPELSPAFGGKIKQSDCTWIGGIDRNLIDEEQDPDQGSIIVICLKSRLRLIRIGEQARKIRDIEVGGVLDLQRRDDLACVADSRSYALLDVVNQRKIDLFPISSDLPRSRSTSPAPTSTPTPRHLDRVPSRSVSTSSTQRPPHLRAHNRQSSLGNSPKPTDRLRPESPWPPRSVSRSSRSPSPSRSRSPAVDTDNKPLPQTPQRVPSPARPATSAIPLRPHVASPNPNEFLLTTGTSRDDPGVGMFVNLDGDVVRGTVDFMSYPDALLLDGQGADPLNPPPPGQAPDEGYILAVVRRDQDRLLEYQRWDIETGESRHVKGWLSLPKPVGEDSKALYTVGLRNAATEITLTVPEITSALSLRRLQIDTSEATDEDNDAKREKDEDSLIAQFAKVQANVLLYAGDGISWVVRNPVVVRLESQLRASSAVTDAGFTVDRDKVLEITNSIRGLEARNESEFLGFNYVRQQASLLLLIDLILTTEAGRTASDRDKRLTVETLVIGEIDPRIIVSIIPLLSDEVIEGPQGMWVPGGLRNTIEAFRRTQILEVAPQDPDGPYGDNLLHVLKEYLLVWRRKKGFGSVADETQVFHTVDASLLHLLLMLDKTSPQGPARAGSVRAELNDVVDHGVECFDRAVELLEKYQRLYILSRLYQSRKQVGQVLATWKRILDGEPDHGGELVDGEQDVRKYLARIKDPQLVKDYGTWLANRNSKLGVQIFADETSRVTFTSTEAVDLLKERAPAAVKDYLEHLVFGKNHIQYVNDLITFYLDTVLDAISTSEAARTSLTDSYTTYRALQPPKPTYRQFITENSTVETSDSDWWANRLRLLQLIGGSHDAANRYDVDKLASRLQPYADVLVPEMIILSGRRGEHVEALRLLVRGLGDYDTAIRYCLLGGSSIFNPSSTMTSSASAASHIPTDPPKFPSKQEQELLFRHLLDEFLHLPDLRERTDRSAELLDKFAPFFDLADVLALLPPDWPVATVETFVTHALRSLVRERNESVVVKALSSAQNLRTAVQFVEKIEGLQGRGAVWESVKKDSGVA
ncbi:hypothetical protein AAFC00_000209 [Neodothiora populina]|uniref:CNH domain-containing protein n=1 Tax=Neodothiora populina TaxID=2781224 RepID=A0ABR3P358_9PEZI